MNYYRRGKPQFEEPVHWEWFDELVRAGVLALVEPDYEASFETAHSELVLDDNFASSLSQWDWEQAVRAIVDAALRIGGDDEAD